MERDTRRQIEEYRRDGGGHAREQPHRRARRRASSTARSSSSGRRCSASGSGRSARCSSYVGDADLALAATEARQGRAARSASASPLRRPARAVPPERRRGARVRRHPGRVPDLHEPARPRSALARDELEAEQGRDGLDVPAAQGRAVPQRQGDDLGRRRRVDEAVRRQGLERGLQPVLRRRPGSRPAGRLRRRFRLKSPVGAFPYLLSQTTYQAIIQPASIAAKPGTWVKSGMIGTGAVQAQELHAEAGRASSSATRATGAAARRSTASRSRSITGSAPLVLALRGGQIDLAMQLSPQEAQPSRTTRSTPTTRSRCRRIGSSACGPTSRCSRTRGFGARRA